MKMGAQIRTGKRIPDTGKRFRDRIRAYDGIIQLLALSEFPISIGKSFSGADLYPPFHFQITVELPRLIFFLIHSTSDVETLIASCTTRIWKDDLAVNVLMQMCKKLHPES